MHAYTHACTHARAHAHAQASPAPPQLLAKDRERKLRDARDAARAEAHAARAEAAVLRSALADAKLQIEEGMRTSDRMAQELIEEAEFAEERQRRCMRLTRENERLRV